MTGSDAGSAQINCVLGVARAMQPSCSGDSSCTDCNNALRRVRSLGDPKSSWYHKVPSFKRSSHSIHICLSAYMDEVVLSTASLQVYAKYLLHTRAVPGSAPAFYSNSSKFAEKYDLHYNITCIKLRSRTAVAPYISVQA